MTDLVPFRREHVGMIAAGGISELGRLVLTEDVLRAFERQSSWTMLAGALPIAAGGVFELWAGRFQGWALINRQAGPYMLDITRAARKVLAGARPGRIELTVRADFTAAHRWARMLGFEVETPRMRNFGPDGADHVGYVCLQGG